MGAGAGAGATTGVDVGAASGVNAEATTGASAGANVVATPGAHVGPRTETHAGAIRFEGVTVRYPGESAPAVDDVTLDIEPGTLAVVLGPSGCGKTTLLKSVNRLVEPTHGRVLIDDKDTAQLEPTALRRRIGYVIQATGLFPHMSVARNIGVVPRLLGWSSVRIAERVDEMLALVNLPPDYGPRAPTQLPGGEAQRVGIARALAADPAFLLMDEPFGSLDAINRLRLQDELCAINRRLLRTILFVTHDVDEALRIADRIVVMREGRIVQAASPLDLLLSPADDFVAELLDADDLFRRLGLMSVGDALALEGVGGGGGGGGWCMNRQQVGVVVGRRRVDRQRAWFVVGPRCVLTVGDRAESAMRWRRAVCLRPKGGPSSRRCRAKMISGTRCPRCSGRAGRVWRWWVRAVSVSAL